MYPEKTERNQEIYNLFYGIDHEKRMSPREIAKFVAEKYQEKEMTTSCVYQIIKRINNNKKKIRCANCKGLGYIYY